MRSDSSLANAWAWLDELCQRVAAGRGAARTLARAVRPQGLSEAEFRLMWVLGGEVDNTDTAIRKTSRRPVPAASQQGRMECDQTALAAALAVSPAQVSGLVERLQARGLIETSPHTDRRRQLWRLSKAGRRVVRTVVGETARPPAEGLGYKAAIVLFAIALVGCNRAFYRQQADTEVRCLVDHKAAQVRATPGSYGIEVDPRSRMYDPYNPDCEPMPPDDPTSHRLMHCVDCKPGSKCWKCAARTPHVENPGWLDHLPRDAEGRVVLDQEAAVRLALLESPNYQEELEELYLSALDVSFERFRFDTQFFGGSEIFFTADGRNRSGTGNSSSRLDVSPFRPGNRLRVEKLTATGGELVVGLANTLMWQFAGPDDYSSNTILDFALVQPLLRGGGRTVVLERLTIAERTLLANVRAMERFRRGFYLNVVTGQDPGEGPSRRGGFFGGSGLEGFSGVGGGGFGRVGGGGGGGFGGFGGGFTGGAGAAGAGGYLGLLQSAQVLQNQRANVVALRDSVEQLQASYDAGRIDRFQVDLARQALYNAQSQLLTAETNYQDSLDNFKVSLGLPPDLPVQIEDTILRQFDLLDPKLSQLQADVGTVLDQLRELRRLAREARERPAAEPGLEVLPEPLLGEGAEPSAEQLADQLATLMEESQRFRAAVLERLAAVKENVAALERSLPERRKLLEDIGSREEVAGVQADPELFSVERLDRRAERVEVDLGNLEAAIDETLATLDEASDPSVAERPMLLEEFVEAMSTLSGQLLELSLVQARARLDAIAFEPIELTPEQAWAIAARYRRDLMNARATLVDTWRLIHFNANDLLSDLDIIFSGDIGNVGDNPLRLRGSRGRLRVGLQFDSPLTRLGERNLYRQSLIEYQQARRNFYQFRDRIYQGLRATLRQLRLNEVNFELRRAAVQVAISQVDLTQLRLSEPPRPGEEPELGATTARDLVQALSDLLNVQNDFLSVWVNYEVQRMSLDYNLGVMELTPEGLRIEQNIPYETYLAVAGDCGELELGLPAWIDALEDSGEGGPEDVPPLRLPPGVEGEEVLPLPNLNSTEKRAQQQPPHVRRDNEVVLASAEMPVRRVAPASSAAENSGAVRLPVVTRLPETRPR